MAGIRALTQIFWLLFAGSAFAIDQRGLAVLINTQDPLSVAIGEYYAQKRGITFQNVVKVAFAAKASLSREEFEQIYEEVKKQTLPHVQAYALAWTLPYRAGCMGITSAFAFGYDPAFCEPGCKPTRPSRYFNANTRFPHRDLKLRPAMALAASSLESAKALIDRGVAADGTRPEGTAYLLTTSDPKRNVRAPAYLSAQKLAEGRFQVKKLAQEALTDRTDVLFYFIGAARVGGLETLRFRPGAIADHLTSAGGVLDAGRSGEMSGQMSALVWLDAGATASYGTVVEPCNLPAKFPHPAVAIGRYLQGETLIEAYWKSVRMPGQGVFIGEPLAAPFTGRRD